MSTIDQQQHAITFARKKFEKIAYDMQQAGKDASEELETVIALHDAWKTLQDIKTLQEINARIARIANVIEER